MEMLIPLVVVFVLGVIGGALVRGWLQKNKPALYDEINEKAKKL